MSNLKTLKILELVTSINNFLSNRFNNDSFVQSDATLCACEFPYAAVAASSASYSTADPEIEAEVLRLSGDDAGSGDMAVPKMLVQMLERNARVLAGLACWLERAVGALRRHIRAKKDMERPYVKVNCGATRGEVGLGSWASVSGVLAGMAALTRVCVGQSVWAAASWQLVLRRSRLVAVGDVSRDVQLQMMRNPLGGSTLFNLDDAQREALTDLAVARQMKILSQL